MVTIRLMRLGSTNRKFYRIVATDEGKKLIGKPLDYLGFWKPDKNELSIDKEKLTLWKSKGAQVSLALNKIIAS